MPKSLNDFAPFIRFSINLRKKRSLSFVTTFNRPISTFFRIFNHFYHFLFLKVYYCSIFAYLIFFANHLFLFKLNHVVNVVSHLSNAPSTLFSSKIIFCWFSAWTDNLSTLWFLPHNGNFYNRHAASMGLKYLASIYWVISS